MIEVKIPYPCGRYVGTVAPADAISDELDNDIIAWMYNNGTRPRAKSIRWSSDASGIIFEDEADVIMFKLKFGL